MLLSVGQDIIPIFNDILLTGLTDRWMQTDCLPLLCAGKHGVTIHTSKCQARM